MKNNQTYQTDHPTIKEITIGDKFILNDGQIVTFVEYLGVHNIYIFIMDDGITYTNDLKFNFKFERDHPWNIKQRYIPLKDKLNLL